MAKVSTSISIDADVKAQAQALFADFGLDLSTASRCRNAFLKFTSFNLFKYRLFRVVNNEIFCRVNNELYLLAIVPIIIAFIGRFMGCLKLGRVLDIFNIALTATKY